MSLYETSGQDSEEELWVKVDNPSKNHVEISSEAILSENETMWIMKGRKQ